MRSKVSVLLSILEEHFGDIVKDVGAALITFDNPTIPQIYRSLNATQYTVAMIRKGSTDCSSKITISNIHQALLILYQHNCLNYCVPDLAESVLGETAMLASNDKVKKIILNETALKAKGFRYSLDENMVMNRLRLSKFLLFAYKTLGWLPVLLLEEIIHHGRLSFEDISKAVIHKVLIYKNTDKPMASLLNAFCTFSEKDIKELISLASNNSDDQIKTATWASFQKLVENQIIMTFSSSTQIINPKVKNLDTRENRNKKSTSTIASIARGVAPAPATTSVPVASVASSKPSTTRKRPRAVASIESTDSLPVELAYMTNSYDGTDNSSSRGAVSKAAKIETIKRARIADGFDLHSDKHDKEKVRWTLNWERFYVQQRFQLCTQLVRERSGTLAGDLVRLVLDMTLEQCQYADFDWSSYASLSARVSLMELYQEMQTRKNTPSNTPSISSSSSSDAVVVGEVTDSQSTAQQQSEGSGSSSSEGRDSIFALDMNRTSQVLELLCLDNLRILVRGAETGGLNMFAVNISGVINHLKQKTLHSIVSERFLEESGRVPQLLLERHGLDQQKISDHIIFPPRETRQRIYVLYKDGWIDTHESSKKSDFNPTSTLYHWRTDEKLLMKTAVDKALASVARFKSRRQDECDKGFSQVDFVTMSDTERAKFARLAAVLGRIDHAIMKLDDTIMLFTNL